MLKTLTLCPFLLKNGLTTVRHHAKHIPTIARTKQFFHSASVSVEHHRMKVQVIPALQDNYMYLIIDEDTKEAAVVDPVCPSEVINAVKASNCKLTRILTTHHHWDHSGGNKQLCCEVAGLQVYGGDERVEAVTCKVEHGSIIDMGCLKIQCLHTPCHTSGHICYYVTKDGAEPAVFTGDTLFIGGCGKFFEGSADQMHKSLNEILAGLPDKTKVYCGHEYTVNNFKFAITVEPGNTYVQERLNWACEKRKNNCPTVPSTICEEKMSNPFMRVCEPAVKDFTKLCNPVDVMACLRAKKDVFKAC